MPTPAPISPLRQSRPSPWVQIAAVVRAEVGRDALSLRALPVYGLALFPVLLAMGWAALLVVASRETNLGAQLQAYANIYGSFTVPLCVFFGCVSLFMNLFRGEILDRTLHYYFLTPIRREWVLAGKYLAGLVTAVPLFAGATLASLGILYAVQPREEMLAHLAGSGGGTAGWAYLAIYAGITALACVGYGAVFLALGLYFKNPILPGIALYFWESLNFLLPPFLKSLSIIHYLKSLFPIPVSEGPFALPAEPAPAFLAVAGVLAVAAGALALAAWRVRGMEVGYGGGE